MNQTPFTWDTWLKSYWFPFLCLGILINIIGIFSTIIEPDGALYATIAKTMVNTGDYVNMTFHKHDWLDKPHFSFWVTALSFKILGITTIGYKLPALLSWALGALYTYKFSKIFYTSAIAKLATLIYLTSTHLVISNNDVRAEPYLTGLIIASVYHFYMASIKKDAGNLVLASALAACAVMTKGIFILITIGSGLLVHWLIKREWVQLFSFRWIVAGVAVLVFILPELICLYYQFDVHPDKIVFGNQNVSGIKFFFWDSQFGRFFNSGPIRGDGDPLFFLHTTLWAFFPWALLFYASLCWRLKNFATEKHEFICFGTVVLTFLLFSISRFQLPHYLNIVFPFMSILSAQYLYNIVTRTSTRWWQVISYFQIVAIFGVIILFLLFYHPHNTFLISLWMICFAVVLIGVMSKWETLQNTFGQTFVSSIMLFGFLNVFFFPEILKYQSGSEAAKFIHNQNPDATVAMLAEDSSPSFDFYYKTEVKHFTISELRYPRKEFFIFCHERFLPELRKQGFQTKTFKTFPHYAVSQPRVPFLNYEVRNKTLEYYLLLKISPVPMADLK